MTGGMTGGKRAVLLLAALAGVGLLFVGAMVRVVTYDEDQHLAAGWLVARGLLPYRDFVYLQPPLQALVLGAVFKVVGGYYLLAGRLLAFVLGVMAAGFLWALLRRLGAGLALASVLMVACLASPFLATALNNTRNDALPLALMLAGLWLHLVAVDRSWWGQAGAALLLGLAVEAKLTYLFGPLAIGVRALWAPGTRLPPVLAGTLVAALPAAAFWWVAPEAFRFGLLDYHLAAPLDWYGRQGMADTLLPASRLCTLVEWLLLGGNLTLVALSAALCLVAMARRRKWKRPGGLLVGMTCGALALAFVPSPAWAMYYAPVAPLLACCIAHLDRTTLHLATPMKKRVLFGVAGLASLPVLLLQVVDATQLRERDGWAGLAAHDAALAVRGAMPRGGTVATLFPHLVMDTAGLRADLAAGPFVFRSGEAIGAEVLGRVNALAPPTLAARLAAAPPAGIFVGPYADAWRTPMDQALAEHARQKGWRAVPLRRAGGTLWLPPGG